MRDDVVEVKNDFQTDQTEQLHIDTITEITDGGEEQIVSV